MTSKTETNHVNWRPLLAITLALLAGTYFYLNHTDGIRPKPAAKKESPDFIIENFTLTQYNDTGQMFYLLKAGRLTHFPGNQSTELKKPDIVTFSANGQTWKASAEQGLVKETEDLIVLEQKVKIVQPVGERSLKIETNYLKLYPNQEFATTDQEVLITRGPGSLRAVGMDSNFVTREIMLHDQVRGQYEKNYPDL